MPSESYKTSKNYERLIELLKEVEQVVGFVDGNRPESRPLTVSVRLLSDHRFNVFFGQTPLFENTIYEEIFTKQCKESNLRFIVPSLESELKT